MNALDWILALLVFAYALSGYWQGFITGAFATAGLLLGGLFGIWLAPFALGEADPSLLVSLGALLIVILSASLGQAAMQFLGSRLRGRITWQPIRVVDAIGGAALSTAAVLIVSWVLGVAIAGAGIVGVTPLVRSSWTLSKIDAAMPDSADRLLHGFNNVVGSTFFPLYLEPFAPERIVEVGPGPKRLLKDPDVVDAGSRVLKIHAENRCGRGIAGTGFLYAPDRLMTNAHVVAGVDEPQVMTEDGPVDARVVHYDSELDVAVLEFDSGDLEPLHFDLSGRAEQGVAVLGFPQDGPYDVQPGRVRAEQRLRSPDIYGHGTVIREVFSLRALVRPGNSGGPVVSSAGDVIGVVFAASIQDKQTGYALTADQVAEAADAGRAATSGVGTGACTG